MNEIVSRIGNRLLAQDEDGGALPTLYAAVADVPPAGFAGPGGFMEQRGAPKLVGRSGAALDADVARRLWDVSEELTGARFPLGAAVAAPPPSRSARARPERARPADRRSTDPSTCAASFHAWVARTNALRSRCSSSVAVSTPPRRCPRTVTTRSAAASSSAAMRLSG